MSINLYFCAFLENKNVNESGLTPWSDLCSIAKKTQALNSESRSWSLQWWLPTSGVGLNPVDIITVICSVYISSLKINVQSRKNALFNRICPWLFKQHFILASYSKSCRNCMLQWAHYHTYKKRHKNMGNTNSMTWAFSQSLSRR